MEASADGKTYPSKASGRRRVEQQLICERYRPLEELGSGGFGDVILAWDTRMQRRVAIKRIPLPEHAGRSSAVPGLAEARTAALLNHPAIVTVLDFETDLDEAFLIMEYVDGASLGDILDHIGGPLDADEAAAVLGPVMSAMEFAHENGVLHLDLKPANILISRDGRVKVADFGLSALSTAFGHGPSEGGTLGFMPLEQLEGGRVTERTDVWALGALTYEILADANPFDAENADDAIFRLEIEDPPPPSNYARVPAGIDTAVMEALHVRPAERYRDVAEFADTLLPLLGDPETGRESLGEIAAELAAEDAEAHPSARVGLWDRLARAGSRFARALAAVEAAWLAWVGLVPFGLQPAPLLGAAALVGLAGALAPSLGTALGALALAAGLLRTGAWQLGLALLLGTGAYWWFVARRVDVAAVVPYAAPLLGTVRLAPLAPLVAGFTLRPVAATAAGFAAAWLTQLVAAASGGGAPYLAVDIRVLTSPEAAGALGVALKGVALQPGPWIASAGWAIAAGAMSLACMRATRTSGALGSIVAGSILIGAYALAGQASGGAWFGTWIAVELAISPIIMFAAALLGEPIRGEDDHAVRPLGRNEGPA